MTFVDKIIKAGFVEQGQKRLLELMPHKEKHIQRWWEHYNTSNGWLGLSVYHPDAWFVKENKELLLSLQGVQTEHPTTEEDIILMQNRAVRYICLKKDGKKIYESFSGKSPSDEIIEDFL